MSTARQERFADRWSTPPWWVTALGACLFFGAVMTVTGVVIHGMSWSQAASDGAAPAVAFGLVFSLGRAWVARRRGAQERAAAGHPTPERYRSAVRAARRGPVPADPVVRAAAVRLVAYRLQLAVDWRPLALVVFAALFAASAIAAALDSPWWLLAALGFLGCFALSAREPRPLRRRLAALTGATGTTGPVKGR